MTLLLASPLNLVSFVMGHRTTTVRQYATPFDLYGFTMFAFVVESATNKSVPFAVFAVGDSGPVDLTTISVEEETRINFTYVTEDGPTTVEVESLTILAKVVHTTRAVALTVSMFIINWVMSLCSVAIAFIVFRRRGGEVTDGVAFLPITVTLSIPTIRSLYVGSPPFGILLGTHQNRQLPVQGLTWPFRRGRILPTNGDSGGVRHGCTGCLRDAAHPGQTQYP